MGRITLFFLFFLCIHLDVTSQVLEYTVEFYFDVDPGYGNGYQIVAHETGRDLGFYYQFETEIPTDHLTSGIHRLFVRVKNENTGKWGFTKSSLFYLNHNHSSNHKGLEYFVDADPGPGNATKLGFEPNQEVSLNFEVPTEGLDNGEHTLFLRAEDQFGKWHIIDSRKFNIDPLCGIQDSPEWAIQAIEYLCANSKFEGIDISNETASNTITRAELATIIFNSIGLTDHNDLATNFPSPYGDLQNPEDWFYKYAKNLLYLEYGDGHSPFDRNRFNFQPDSSITKAHAIKILLEAWNISPEDGDLPFTDVDSNHEVYGYLVAAYNNHVFNDSPYEEILNPNEAITWAEISLFTYNLIQEKGTPEITEEDFFVPGNITPLTLSSPPSISEGYFDYSGGISFAIPSVGLPLVFGHSYNSFYHELPKELNTGVNNSQTPIKPLGAGWSHSFNSYMLRLEEQDGNERWAIVWPDGAYHFYNQSGNGYKSETLGVYDTLLQENEDRFQLITKGQTTYTFERIPGSLEAFPFVLTSIKDRNNNSIRIIYSLSENNGWYRISEVIGTKGRKLTFSYWAGSDLVSTITDPAGRSVKFEYDSKSNSRANLIKFTDVKGNIETYKYTEISGFSFLAKISFPDGNQILNEYDPLLRKLISTENKYASSKLTFTHHFNYSEKDGDFNYSAFTDENNLNYRAGRNFAGRLTQFQSPIGLNTTKYEGSSVVLPSSITGIDNVEAFYEYDSKANVTKIRLPTGIEHTFTYNDLNDVLSYTDPLGNTTSYQYDNAGNLESIITAEGGETTFERLENGFLKSVTSPEGITIRFEYDDLGNLIKTEAPEGIVTEAVFDILGRVEKQFNSAGQEYLFEYDKYDNTVATIDPLGYKTRYQYDQITNDLDAIVNAKNKATNLTYDSQNRLTKEEFEGTATSYDFDDLGFLDTYTDPSGHQFKMVYDDVKRLTDNGYSQITYDDKNNIETVKSPEGKTITYSYDNVLNRIEAISFEDETIGYEYDQIGNLIKLTYPDGKEVSYKYDKENRLTEVIDWADNKTIYTYLKDGRLSTMTYPNQIKNLYHYDNAGRSLGFEVQKSDGSKLYSYAYILDPTGKHIHEDYDGEINQQFQQEEASISYQYNASNRIQKAGETTFDFDANGNTIRKGNTTFSYDLWNNLTHLSSPTSEIAYTYDGLGNRRSRTENGQTTRYSLDILGMSRVLVEHLQEDKKNYYVYGLGLISRLDESDNASHYHYDFRGSTIALTDQNQTITHSYIYDVFGETLSSTEANYNPFRFVGKHGVMHEADDFYFMRARYYDASIGRFLSEDPIWSTNLYIYGGNDPFNKIDPSGEIFWDVIDVVSFVHSTVEFVQNPTLENAAFLAWDAVALLPVIPSSAVAKVATKGVSNYGDDIVRVIRKSKTKKVHGNSKLSTKQQHGYVVKNKNGDIQEYGISGQTLNKNGTSPRARQKLRTKYNNSDQYHSEVIDINVGSRRDALNWEINKVIQYKNAVGQTPPKQFRPKIK